MRENQYYPRFMKDNSGGSYIPSEIPYSALDQTDFYGLFQGYTTSPIPFSKELAEDIKRILEKGLLSRDPLTYIVPEYLRDICGNEVKRLICAIFAYLNSPNPVMSRDFLISGITDFKFASKLKKIRTKSFLNSYNLHALEEDPDMDNIPSFTIDDIGDIFNYAYWFFWKEEEPEDYKYGFEDLDLISKSDIDIFESEVYDLLPKNVEYVREEEILLSNSSSGCFDAEKFQRSKVWKKKGEKGINTFSSLPLEGIRTVVRVSPENVRDTIELSVQQSNSIKLIERQCALICEDLPFSIYYRNPEKFEKYYNKFRDKYFFFLDRDIKKEGITKPRLLLTAIGRALRRKYPEMPCLKYFGIYENYYLHLDLGGKSKLNPPRGHGLGMANALTTIMQCALFSIIAKHIVQEEVIGEGFSAIFYNDDSTIGFMSEEDMESYINHEDDILKRYGIIRHKKKSHCGQSFVLCEKYSAQVANMKISYQLNEICQIFAACNIVHAKMLFSNLSRHIERSWINWGLGKLVSFFGYEFFQGEWENPYSFGGWISPNLMGIRLDIVYLKKLNYNAQRALFATEFSEIKLPQRKDKKYYISPLEQLYGSNLDLNGQDQILFYKQRMDFVRSGFSRRFNRNLIEISFKRLLKKRFDTYQKRLVSLLPIEEIFLILKKRFPFTDFLPWGLSISYEEIIKTESLPDFEEYLPANPILSYIKFFNSDRVDDKVIPDPRFLRGGRPHSKLLSAEDRRQFLKINEFMNQKPGWEIQFYRDRKFPNWLYSIYYDPGSVYSVYCTITGKINLFPIPKGVKERSYKIDDRYINCIHDPSLQTPLIYFTEKFGWKFTSQFISNLRDLIGLFEEFYSPIVREKRRHIESDPELEELRTEDTINQLGIDPNNQYLFNEYWRWESEGCPIFNSELYDVFDEISVFIHMYHSDLQRGWFSLDKLGSETDPYNVITRNMERIWILNGGQIHTVGVVRLLTVSSNSFWDMEEDDDEPWSLALFGD